MAKEFPVGTIRHWEQGDVIKAHDPIHPYSSGWIPLVNNPELLAVGQHADSVADRILQFKDPINGELFLDHIIDTYEDDEGRKLFKSGMFKAYQGFYGAGRYSFRNVFSKLFMQEKMQLDEDVCNALKEANEDKDGDKKEDHLTAEEKKAIRAKVRAEFKAQPNAFTLESAKQLLALAQDALDKLREGLDFRDPAKKAAYAKFKSLADSIPDSYAPLKDKRKIYAAAFSVLEEHFSDNWGVYESGKNYLEDKFQRFVKLYGDKIRDENLKNQIEEFGVSIDMPTDEFYNRIYDKINDEKNVYNYLNDFVGEKILLKFEDNLGNKTKFESCLLTRDVDGDFIITSENSGRSYDLVKGLKQDLFELSAAYKNMSNFKELIYLRFVDKYNKRIEGDWQIQHLPVIHNIELLVDQLPAGHFLTNDELTLLTNQDYAGGTNGGYAWYSPNEKRINLSSNCVDMGARWGVLARPSQFNSVMLHEIGHAVSWKLGRTDYYDYKKFVVECGWTYQSPALRYGNGGSATGDDKDTPRTGSNGSISLMTGYAHKSPEEAFAEYYSLYANNKQAIDSYLRSNKLAFLESHQKVMAPARLLNMNVREAMPHKIIENDHPAIKAFESLTLSTGAKEIKQVLTSPWDTGYSVQEKQRLNPETIRAYKDRDPYENESGMPSRPIPPLVGYEDRGKTIILDGVNRNETARMNRKTVPVLTFSKELYYGLKNQGLTDDEVSSVIYSQMRHEKIISEAGMPKVTKGLLYEDKIIPREKFVENKKAFEVMAKIFNSEELKKAIASLFSHDEDEDNDIQKAHRYTKREMGKNGKWKYFYEETQGVKYLKGLVNITNGAQQEYFKTQVEKARPARIASSEFILNDSDYQALRSMRKRFQPKQCYHNAYLVAQEIPGVKYVEGLVFVYGVPIDHAWNEKDGKYFDVTEEFVLKHKLLNGYTSVLELNSYELSEYVLQTGHSGPFFRNWYADRNKDIKKSFSDIAELYLLGGIRDELFGRLLGRTGDISNQ